MIVGALLCIKRKLCLAGDGMLKTHSFVMTSGERYVIILDSKSGVPHYSTSLFLTTQLRNADRAHATMLNAAGHLVLFYRYLESAEIDLLHRLQSNQIFRPNELDALRDFCSMRNRHGESFIGGRDRRTRVVDRKTLHTRLSTIGSYVQWFAGQLFDYSKAEPEWVAKAVTQMRARRPRSKGGSPQMNKGLSEFQLNALIETLDISSVNNPFTKPLRERNRLIVLLEHELGIRAGELLNLRIEDCDFSTNSISIVRRADQKDDPRQRQPLVKTRARRLPASSELMANVHQYIIGSRRNVANARKTPYLFVTHKRGPTSGHPLTTAGYQKVWSALRNSSVALAGIHGHCLRHTWNHHFSQAMDAQAKPPSEHEQELIRSRLMGWKEGSGSARHYNERFIIEKANLASLKLQSRLRTRGSQNEES